MDPGVLESALGVVLRNVRSAESSHSACPRLGVESYRPWRSPRRGRDVHPAHGCLKAEQLVFTADEAQGSG